MLFLKSYQIENNGILMLSTAERKELNALNDELFGVNAPDMVSKEKVKRYSELANKKIDAMKSLLN